MPEATLSKSEFLTYLGAPMHLWALKNDAFESALSPLDVLIMNQGYAVEKYASDFMLQLVSNAPGSKELQWQPSYQSGNFHVRADAIVQDTKTGTSDLYEIKSGTSLKKDHILDAAFQHIVIADHLPLERIFILHLNKDYIRCGKLAIGQLFIAEDITADVQACISEVREAMGAALAVADAHGHQGIESCLNPKSCPCPDLCHPGLPEGSIFEVPGLRANKKRELLEAGVSLLTDIPSEFPLSAKQRQVVDVAISGRLHHDPIEIAREIGRFTYPLFFLDYESCISAIPLFDGYHPQQQIVFQYSLHRLDAPGSEVVHTEFVDLEDRDPAALLLPRLKEDIGSSGTVFVWNKSFEMTCNKEMARVQPEFGGFLAAVNERIYDLADFVRNGLYLHPEFKGRWSLKNVLPAMVPALSYQSLEINNGSMASAAWWEATQKRTPDLDVEELRQNLLRYCELDTLAMVEILRVFEEIAAA